MKKQLLIIDDDIGIRSLLEFYLKKYYEVTVKSNGLEALLWLETGNIPDIIIVDINMPELGGYEFVRLIRGSGFFRDIPLMVLSGLTDDKVKMRCFAEGANLYMTKPFNPDMLLINLRTLINGEDEYYYA